MWFHCDQTLPKHHFNFKARERIMKAYNQRVYLIVAVVIIATTVIQISSFQTARASSIAYYIDCNGNDNNSGTSASQAWKSLSKGSAAALSPGDQLLLKRGCSWTTTTEGLTISASGTASAPISVSSYGTGALPIITAVSNSTSNVNTSDIDGILLTGSYIIVNGITLTGQVAFHDPGCANVAIGSINGVRILQTFDTVINSIFTGLSRGILVSSPGGYATITNNTILNDNVMEIDTPTQQGSDDDAGAFGVVLAGNNNTVEHNVISGDHACSYDYGTDGSAVEIYGGNNNVIAFNRSTDNDTFSELGLTNTTGNVYAYNVVTSTLTTMSSFLVTRGGPSTYGPVYNTIAEHNSIYLPGSGYGVDCEPGCNSSILTLRNNAIWADNNIGYSVGGPFAEDHNLYWSTNGQPNIWFQSTSSTDKIGNPQWTNPSGGDLHLLSNSAAIGVCTTDAAMAQFTKDFDGNPVSCAAGAFASASQPILSSATATATAITASPTIKPSATLTPTLTATVITASPTIKPSATLTPTLTATVIIASPTIKPSATLTPTLTATVIIASPTIRPSVTPTFTVPATTSTPVSAVSPIPISDPLTQIIQAGSLAVTRSGQWTVRETRATRGGNYVYSDGSANDALSLTFIGASIDVVYVRNPNLGSFGIMIDGRNMLTVDSKAVDTRFRSRAQIRNLLFGLHTVRVYALTGVIAIEEFVVPPQPITLSATPTNQPSGITGAQSVLSPTPTNQPPKATATQIAPSAIPTNLPPKATATQIAPSAIPTNLPPKATATQIAPSATPINFSE